MTKTTQASPDGIKVLSFFEGKEYVLTPQLAKALVGAYVVAEAKEEAKATAPPNNKATAPKENK